MHRSFAILATVAVALHAAIAALHGMAHSDLGIVLSPAQNTFINVVIVAAPLIAVGLAWARYTAAAAVLLAGSLAASLLFGVYYHYVLISSDHVAHLPPGHSQGVFRVTAALLPVTEALGIGVGVWGWSRRGR